MKKTREYYEALLDLGFVKGEKLTKAEEKQHKANLLTLPTAKAGGFSVQPPQPAHARSYTVSPSV